MPNSSIARLLPSQGNEEAWSKLESCDGVLVPGGFGNRGIEGKILAIKHAREEKKPFLGICLGMQMAVVEYMRNVMGLKDAHSTEFEKGTATPAIHTCRSTLHSLY
eukprot:scaffold283613_cov31-Prasinocladus_malaysianus.AAC.1